MKIVLIVDEEDCKNIGGLLDLHVNKPLLLEIITDIDTLRKQLVQISPEQRAKVFALIRDISEHIGDTKENARMDLMAKFCEEKQIEMFSLSDCMADTAGDFIEWLILFCFENGVPLKEVPANALDDIEKYIQMCVSHKRCMACGKEGKVYIMGKEKFCLCDVHYWEAKQTGWKVFSEKYHFPTLVVNN